MFLGEVRRERELDEDAVNPAVVIELINQRVELLLRVQSSGSS